MGCFRHPKIDLCITLFDENVGYTILVHMTKNTHSKIHKLQIMASDGERKMLEELCARFSCNASELIRGYVRDQHKRVFPAYGRGKKIKPIEEAISDEQYCEMLGGRVGKNSDGNPVCVKGTWGVPLDRRDLMKSRFKE